SLSVHSRSEGPSGSIWCWTLDFNVVPSRRAVAFAFAYAFATFFRSRLPLIASRATVRRVAWQFEAAYTIALKPKRWRFGRRSGGERIAAFAMKHIQPFRSRLLDTVPIHYFLAFRAIGVRNYR